MNNTTGLQLAERAGSENIPSLFVLVSAYDEFSYALQALHIGAFDYLLKPLTKEIIQTVIKKIRKHYDREIPEVVNYVLPKPSGMNQNFKNLIEFLQDNYMNPIHELRASYPMNLFDYISL